ncbi:PDR/VanB family oxidoreductase [Rhizomonospora bruguierae]|uniref:PDR/VanB family oxidoreductase n=1 Tax=Rhizomonospora bruguierae TaxID=1581705 RepID=UPI001BCB7955|nr:PDR/VanB family oxidoreductase [Micromonospora sp. NBRC 107566]
MTDIELLARQLTWESDGVLSVVLTTPDGGDLPPWEPGAHLDLRTGDLIRQYSLCGDPADRRRYRIAVRRTTGSRGGSAFVHDRLRPGQTVRVGGPRNHFRLETSPRYLFLAGGIGITPLLPMVRQVAAQGRKWHLVYGGRTRASMPFLVELAEYGDAVELVPQDERGLLDLDTLLREAQPDTLIYCCGPEPLLAEVEARCAAWPPGSLRLERFAPKPQEGEPDPGAPFEVICQRSGTSVLVEPDASIVDTLESVDVWIPSACREGICGTCETRVIDGVPDHRDSLLSEEERAGGKVLLPCVSRALSKRLVLDV